ncbi:MAG: hypothetical protein ACREQF_06650, partial [Candidatus Binataceae bacterium]
MKRCFAGRARWLAATASGAVMLLAAEAMGQVQPPNNPPPGAYQPIPNFSGPGAGLLFRRAINDRFSGAATVAPAVVRLPLGSLPPVVDGMVFFCTDCKRANPCATGGSGAWAMGARGTWRCTEGPLEADLDAAGRRLTNVSAAAASGDALSYGQSGAVLAGLGASGQKVTNVAAGAAAGDALAFAQTGAKLKDMSDTGATDGTNAIAQFSINGVRNLRNWGAAASATTTSATTSASSANITVSPAGDFKAGQGVKISQAAGAPSVSTPTGLMLDRQSYTLNPDPTGQVDGSDLCQTSGWSEGTVDYGNANCTTTRRYAVTAIDGQGGWSAPTSITQLTNAADTLSASNTVYVSWSSVSSAAAYAIYTCKGAACTPTLKAVVPANLTFYRDASDLARYVFAADEEFGGVLQTGAKNKDVYTTITAISGTTFTLAAAPAQSGTFTMRHDDGAALNAAVAGVCATGGEIFVPTGTYTVGTTISLVGCAGVRITGMSHPKVNHQANATIDWHGPLGGTVFDLEDANGNAIENLAVHGAATTPGVAFDLDRSATPVGTPSHNRLGHIYIGQAGIGVAIARSSTSNNELHTFDDVTMEFALNGKGGYMGYYIGGGWQTNNERYFGGSTTQRVFGFYLSCPGHLDMFSPNMGQNVFDFWSACGSGAGTNMVGLHTEESQMFWHGPTGTEHPITITAMTTGMGTSLNGYVAYFGGPVVMTGSVVT